MFRLIILVTALLSLTSTVRSVTTNIDLRLVYNSDATLACSSAEASTFYKTTKAGVRSTIAADATKYSCILTKQNRLNRFFDLFVYLLFSTSCSEIVIFKTIVF